MTTKTKVIGAERNFSLVFYDRVVDVTILEANWVSPEISKPKFYGVHRVLKQKEVMWFLCWFQGLCSQGSSSNVSLRKQYMRVNAMDVL